MFRISQFMQALAEAERSGKFPAAARRRAAPPVAEATTLATPVAPASAAPRAAVGPVVIWNLIRRCNLTCKHCYALSADHEYAGELSTAEVFSVMQDLRGAARVPALILSGGEPLLRPDIFEVALEAKRLGFYTGLSTNGTLIDAALADRITATGFDYVGISLDGIGATHDRFRRLVGAFDRSLAAVRLLQARGVKVGLRYTMTAMNSDDLPALLQLMQIEGVAKFYFSHLNYAGRGNIHRARDAQHAATRDALDLLFDTAWADAQAGRDHEYVTGNNDADGPYLLQWVQRHLPRWRDDIAARLVAWGGNASGVGVANIDNLGNVHPDTMWWHHTLGNVRERPFSAIWQDLSDPLMAGLKQHPRPVEGRCAQCQYLTICNGNTRVRAQQTTGNPWAEDPGCYLDDDEIGVQGGAERVEVTAFSGRRKVVSLVAE
ncbi:MAG: heme d1 biosynthesis radical SAM protein NirJ [Leptothrix sp. (in: b-proteobacteria)]